MLSDTELKEILKLRVTEGQFGQLKRIFPKSAELATGRCIVDEMDSEGDLIGDPICIEAHEALWLVKEFFGMPERDWKKIKMPEDSEAATGGGEESKP